jgi:hypothetical protein
LFDLLADRFRPAKAREIIAAVLSSRLSGTAYNADKMSLLSREIADEIKQRLKGDKPCLIPPISSMQPVAEKLH